MILLGLGKFVFIHPNLLAVYSYVRQPYLKKAYVVHENSRIFT